MSALVHQVTPVIAGALAPDAEPYTGKFAYDGLEPGAAAIARQAAEAIRKTIKTANRALSEIGSHLLRAKRVLLHGEFEAWAEDEFGFSSRTARNYMQAAGWLEGKSEILSDLPPTIIYTLASPTAPKDVVQDVLAAVEAGSPLPPPVIRHKLARARDEGAELKLAQKRNPKITAADLAAKNLRHREKHQAAHAKGELERQQREFERQTELLPLAREVFGLGRDVANAVLEVMSGAEARNTFTGLLRRFLDGAEA